MLKITPIPAFNDNYFWLITREGSKNCVVVDPGLAEPVIDYLNRNKLKLCTILITHKHADHTGGMLALKARTQATIYGPKNDGIEGLDVELSENDTLSIASLHLTFKVLELPGHTLGHIAYLGDDLLFCGDTLFSGGCGRVFEGTYKQMFASLMKLKALPNKTKLFCAHEYTLDNLKFGTTVEPENLEIQTCIQACIARQTKNQPTLPSTIGLEKRINVFLRAKTVDQFSTIRKQKNLF